MERAATIRDALRREGLGGADLETAVLAYTVANNLRVDTSSDVETMAHRGELFRRFFGPVRTHPFTKENVSG
jgi:hypothetical protein